MTDREPAAEKYAPINHVSRNHLGHSRLLITFLSLGTRLTLFLTAGRSKISQNVLVNQGTDYWCGVVNHSLDRGLSTVGLHDEFLAFLAHREEFAGYLAAKAKNEAENEAKAKATPKSGRAKPKAR